MPLLNEPRVCFLVLAQAVSHEKSSDCTALPEPCVCSVSAEGAACCPPEWTSGSLWRVYVLLDVESIGGCVCWSVEGTCMAGIAHGWSC